jgi:allantoinase
VVLAPNRFDYTAINDRPKITWPNNARVAFWVAPNIEHYEYTPLSRPKQPDIPHYVRNDYGNRIGFWRMMDLLNKYGIRGCTCLNLGVLDHFPEVRQAMIDADWRYMAHGVYNTRPLYGYTVEQERAYWADFIATVKKYTGKQVKGRLGGGGGYTDNTDDLMAEAGCTYHTSWIIDDQPVPIKVKGGQRFIYVPYSGQTNDVIIQMADRETDFFYQQVKDQFDTLYREGADSGRVMCVSLHPQMIGRPNSAKYLDEMLKYVLGHDGVWLTTADEIADYYLEHHYDEYMNFVAERARKA